MKKKNVVFSIVTALMLISCATPKVAYFQNVQPGAAETVSEPMEIRIRPGDKISILVNSKDQLLVNLFNLPVITRQIGMTSNNNTSQGISGYTVNDEGNIDFPVLGNVHVEGMTRAEIAAYIKKELMEKKLPWRILIM